VSILKSIKINPKNHLILPRPFGIFADGLQLLRKASRRLCQAIGLAMHRCGSVTRYIGTSYVAAVRMTCFERPGLRRHYDNLVTGVLVGDSKLAHRVALFGLAMHRRWKEYQAIRPAVAKLVARIVLPIMDWVHHVGRRQLDPLYSYVHATPVWSKVVDRPEDESWENLLTPGMVAALLLCAVAGTVRVVVNQTIRWRQGVLQRRLAAPYPDSSPDSVAAG
jgi:hypothetical protein